MPSKEVYWANPEKYRKATRKYALDNPDWHREANREWIAKDREKNPEKHKQVAKRYRSGHKDVLAERTRGWLAKHPGYHMLKNAFQRAKRDNLPFNITLDDIVVPDVCPVLGIPLKVYRGKGSGGFKDDGPSLDKVIPSLGYVKGNIRVISGRANNIKRDATAAELRLVADYIDRHTGSG